MASLTTEEEWRRLCFEGFPNATEYVDAQGEPKASGGNEDKKDCGNEQVVLHCLPPPFVPRKVVAGENTIGMYGAGRGVCLFPMSFHGIEALLPDVVERIDDHTHALFKFAGQALLRLLLHLR